MSKHKLPEPAKKATLDEVENRDGKQLDDNIDDLGRDINNPDKKPVEQPTGTEGI